MSVVTFDIYIYFDNFFFSIVSCCVLKLSVIYSMEYFSDAIEFNIMFLLSYSENKSLNRKKWKKEENAFLLKRERKIAWFDYFGESKSPLFRGKEGGRKWERQITIRKFLIRVRHCVMQICFILFNLGIHLG